MRELEQRQKLKRRIYSTPVLVLLALVTIFLVRGAYNVVSKQIESSRHVKDLKNQASTMASRQAELQSNIERLKTDEGIDEEIKRKFSVSKEGEHVAIIVDARSMPTSTESKPESKVTHWFTMIESLWQGSD